MSGLEGSLPECLKGVAIFEDKQATWHDGDICPEDYKPGQCIAWGTIGSSRKRVDDTHPSEIKMLLRGDGGFQVADNLNEAKQLWVKAQEWIRA